MELDFTMVQDQTRNCLLWKLKATYGDGYCIRIESGEYLNKHQTENLAYVPVEQLRADALLLLTQTATQDGAEKLFWMTNNIVCDVIYQNLGAPWEPIDEYDTPPTYDPHWAKKVRHGEDI